MDTKQTIGQICGVVFPELGDQVVPARIDTGAQTSAIWVSSVTESEDAGLVVVFFAEGSPLHSNHPITFADYDTTIVTSSNGKAERRYKVQLQCEIAGQNIRSWFTLADRSTQKYPILIGRNVLHGRFIVDVAVKQTVHPHQDQSGRTSDSANNEDIL